LLEAVRYEPRDAAIIELLLQTGMRLSEVAGMKIIDVALPARISKEPGKALSSRTCPQPPGSDEVGFGLRRS
jgi:integrase